MTTYADDAKWYRTPMLEQEEVAAGTFRVRLECPEIAGNSIPGQFVMLRIASLKDPLIGRALAVFDTYGPESGRLGIDLIYVAKGKFTSCLAQCRPGQELEVWGPLGNGFSREPVDHLILVAGGVGETPMLGLGREALGGARLGNQRDGVSKESTAFAKKVTLCYGARTANLLACVEQFRAVGIDVRLSTDDGSIGQKQRVTQTLLDVLSEGNVGSARIACCGPEPMMEAVALIAKKHHLPCEVSLETPMACGIGICFTCVAKIGDATCEDWDYRRTCVEGPVFEASRIVWH